MEKSKTKALEEAFRIQNTKELETVFKDKNKWSALREEYEKILEDLGDDFNNTSVVVYHGPVEAGDRSGTLITGDISLRKGFAILQMKKHFKSELKYIGVFSVPHHGSKYNWGGELLKDGEFDRAVSFASTHNYYANRMNGTMMSDFRIHNIFSLVVDERRESELLQYIEKFSYGWECGIFQRDLHEFCELWTI